MIFLHLSKTDPHILTAMTSNAGLYTTLHTHVHAGSIFIISNSQIQQSVKLFILRQLFAMHRLNIACIIVSITAWSMSRNARDLSRKIIAVVEQSTQQCHKLLNLSYKKT